MVRGTRRLWGNGYLQSGVAVMSEARRLNDEIGTLRTLLENKERTQWAIGEEVIRLTGLGFKVKEIAETLGREPNELSEFRRAATEFPEGPTRDVSVPFTHFLVARRVIAKGLATDLHQARQTITRRGLGQPRDALRYFGRVRAERENAANVSESAVRLTGAVGRELIGRCHHRGFEAVLAELGDELVTILHADPPFGNFVKTASGKFDMSTSAAQTECDNADNESALRVTVDLLRLSPRVMKPGGVLLLWQSSKLLRAGVIAAIEENGWAMAAPEVWWNKGHPKLEDGEGLYGSQSERLLVLARRGDKPRNCAPDLSRGNILNFDPVRMKAEESHEHHAFEKPAELNQYLVRKHSYEGDLIFDAFGCTGSFTIAAAELGRRWIYCESNPDNFAFGSGKVEAAVVAAGKKSA
jgi:DNA modification methylase